MTGPDRAGIGGVGGVGGIVEAVVEVLDAEPLFAEPASLSMLALLTGRQLGLPLQVPSVPFRRQWLLAFVSECAATDGGLDAMASVVGQMDGRGRVYRVVDSLVRGAAGRSSAANGQRRKPPFPGPASESLTVGEATALADVYSDPAAARRLLERAGLPYRRQPRPERSSEAFWSEVNRLVIDGAFPEGRVRILREAAADYPANPWFSAG